MIGGHKRSNSKMVIAKSNIRLKTPGTEWKKPKHMKSKSTAKSSITNNYKRISKTGRIKTKKKYKDSTINVNKYAPSEKKKRFITKANNINKKK